GIRRDQYPAGLHTPVPRHGDQRRRPHDLKFSNLLFLKVVDRSGRMLGHLLDVLQAEVQTNEADIREFPYGCGGRSSAPASQKYPEKGCRGDRREKSPMKDDHRRTQERSMKEEIYVRHRWQRR